MLMFASQNLVLFSKTMCLSERVEIHMAAETPLMLVYRFGEGGELKYYLAPKMEN